MLKRKTVIISFCAFILFISMVIVKYYFIENEIAKVNKEDLSNELNGAITFVSNRTDKRLELEELIEEFESENPNVTVELELLGDAEEILQRKASVGELPDVTLVPGVIPDNQFNQYFLPIDDLNFNDENMYNTYLGIGSDNNQYAVTTSLSWFGVIYNKKIFEQFNIEKTPTTIEELLDDCEKIKEEGNIVPIVLNYKQSWIMNTWIENVPYLFNSDLEDKVINDKCKILDKDSELYESLNLAKSIYDNNYCEEDILNYDWAQCKNDIVNNKIAMIIWNSDFVYQLEDMGMNSDDIGMFPVPGTKQISLGGDYRFAISKTTTHEKEAKAFLKFLIEDDRYAKAVNIMSSLKSSERSKELLDDIEEFGIPIKFQGDILKEESQEAKERHRKFVDLKNTLKINYKFVQQYITSENTDKLIEDANEEYSDYMNDT